MFFLIQAVITAGSAFEIFNIQSEDYLGGFGRLQVLVNHAVSVNPLVDVLIDRLRVAGEFGNDEAALREFYEDSTNQLACLLPGNCTSLIEMSPEQLGSKCIAITELLTAYVVQWETQCMFRYLPTRMRNEYLLYFDSRNHVSRAREIDIPALILQPGVILDSVVSFNDSRPPYIYDHLIPGKLVGMYYSIADTCPVRYADLAGGCSVHSRRLLKLLPTQRVALEVTTSHVLVWRASWSPITIPASPSYQFDVTLRPNKHGDGFYVMLLNGEISQVIVYSSADLSTPMVNCSYPSGILPRILGDKLFIRLYSSSLLGTRLIDLDPRDDLDTLSFERYYHSTRRGVLHIKSSEMIARFPPTWAMNAPDTSLPGSDIIPLLMYPRNSSTPTSQIVFLNAEHWRISRAVIAKCQISSNADTSSRLRRICEDPGNWELTRALLVSSGYLVGMSIEHFLDTV